MMVKTKSTKKIIKTVGIERSHEDWLIRNPSFNLSKFLRDRLDKYISSR